MSRAKLEIWQISKALRHLQRQLAIDHGFYVLVLVFRRSKKPAAVAVPDDEDEDSDDSSSSSSSSTSRFCF